MMSGPINSMEWQADADSEHQHVDVVSEPQYAYEDGEPRYADVDSEHQNADEDGEPQLMWDVYFEEWKYVNTLASGCDISIGYYSSASVAEPDILDWDGYDAELGVDERRKLRRKMRELRSTLEHSSDDESNESATSCISWWSLPKDDACYPSFANKSGFKRLSDKAKHVLANMWAPGQRNYMFSGDIFDDYESVQGTTSPQHQDVTKEKQTLVLPTDTTDTLNACLQWVINHNHGTTNSSSLREVEHDVKDQSREWQVSSAASSLGYHTAGASMTSHEQIHEISYTSRDSASDQEWHDARSGQSPDSIDGYEGLFANLDITSLTSSFATCFTSAAEGKAHSVASGCSFMENLAATLGAFDFVSYYWLYFPVLRETNSYEESEVSFASEDGNGKGANLSIASKQPETTVPSHLQKIEYASRKQHELNNVLVDSCSKPERSCYDRSKTIKCVSFTKQNTPKKVEKTSLLQESPKELNKGSHPPPPYIHEEFRSSQENMTKELMEFKTSTLGEDYMSKELLSLIERRTPSENAVYLEVKERLALSKQRDDQVYISTSTRLTTTSTRQIETTDLKRQLKYTNTPVSQSENIPHHVIDSNIKYNVKMDAMKNVDSLFDRSQIENTKVKRQFQNINKPLSESGKKQSHVTTGKIKHNIKKEAMKTVDSASNRTQIEHTKVDWQFKNIQNESEKDVTDRREYSNAFTTYKPQATKTAPKQDTIGVSTSSAAGEKIHGYYLSATQMMVRPLPRNTGIAKTPDGSIGMTQNWNRLNWTDIRVGSTRK